jgi:ABC-type dipeptide/oligopeptide/nickel transport system permease subunit
MIRLFTSKEITNLSTRFAVVVIFSLPFFLILIAVIAMLEAFKVEATSTFFSRSCLITVVVFKSVVNFSLSAVKATLSAVKV